MNINFYAKKKRKPKKKKKSNKKTKSKIRKNNLKSNKIPKKKKRNSKKKVQPETTKQGSQELIFKTKQEWIKASLANKSQYQNKYNESIKNNNSFWKKEGKRITWIKPYKKIKDIKYSKDEVKIKWYED